MARNYVSQEIKITELDDIGIGLYLYYGQSDDGQLYQEWKDFNPPSPVYAQLSAFP